MKLSDIMQRSLVTVSENTLLKEVARIIFRLGLAGIPVIRGKKLVGIVTEKDILSSIYPTMQELADDYVHARDFEIMEKNFASILNLPVSQIMSKGVISKRENTALMEAQSTMLVNNISRLPVVDSRNNLVGIVSQGDIFRALMRHEVLQLEVKGYESFVSHYYDNMVNWDQRFKYELPVLTELLQREKAKKIIDLGTWTGKYTIAVAQKSDLTIVGVDHNPAMISLSEEKRKNSNESIRKRVSFQLTNYENLSKDAGNQFDAAISMGNAFPFIPIPLKDIARQLGEIISKKNGIVILQILNFDKYQQKKDRLLSFVIKPYSEKKNKEHLSVDFFDKKDEDTLLHHTVLFDREGDHNWIYKGTTTIPIHYVTKEKLKILLGHAGFSSITFSGGMGEYQGEYGPLSFKDEFNPLESDWLNVVAKR